MTTMKNGTENNAKSQSEKAVDLFTGMMIDRMNKPMGIIQGKSKYQRDEKLAEDRKNCFKL